MIFFPNSCTSQAHPFHHLSTLPRQVHWRENWPGLRLSMSGVVPTQVWGAFIRVSAQNTKKGDRM